LIAHYCTFNFLRRVAVADKMSSQPIAIEADEIDDLPAYNPSSSSAAPHSHTATPQPEVYGRINNIAGEVATDRRYTGGDTLDEPVSTTIVTPKFRSMLTVVT
jgi:hypothetical protein